jgi:hypothetical protein
MRNIVEEQSDIMVKRDIEFRRIDNLCKETFGVAKELLEMNSELKKSLFHKQRVFEHEVSANEKKVHVKIFSNANLEKTKKIYATIGEESFVIFKDNKRNRDRYNIRLTWSEADYVGDEYANGLFNALRGIKNDVISSKLQRSKVGHIGII